MALPSSDTEVSYPGGAVTGTATVLHVTDHDRGTVVLTDRTPCHPVDPRWPDQGPDLGELAYGGLRVPLADCVIGATDGVVLNIGDDVAVRRGDAGWAFVVAHIINGQPPAVGDDVTFAVDPLHRSQLSAGHTGCHVAALALNGALAPRWRKPVKLDGLGRPDFDQLAIVTSRIVPDGAIDSYRLGKSLRKKGFDSEGLDAALPEIEEAMNRQLATWVAGGSDIELDIHGPKLTDLREWVCTLPEGTQRIPCGGTHLTSLGQLATMTVALRLDPTLIDPALKELTMTTTVERGDRSA